MLERGIDVMAEADPLRLLVHAKRGVAKPAVRGDHAAPERQAFSPLPVVPAYPSGSGGGDA
ncbi:hypothetical protein AKI39_19905 [Bordetella sp. H567]|nr:hypothetical protein AKI39_19905 [Bordetella sp. H567]